MHFFENIIQETKQKHTELCKKLTNVFEMLVIKSIKVRLANNRKQTRFKYHLTRREKYNLKQKERFYVIKKTANLLCDVEPKVH